MDEENTTPTHECTGDDCQHESHTAAAPVADAPAEEAAPATEEAAPTEETTPLA